MRSLSAFSCCWWVYGFKFTSLSTQTLPQIWEYCLKFYLMQVCKPCQYALIEAVEPFKLHPMYMTYLYEVSECFLRLWMGKWLHIHNVTITDISSDLWELAEILPDASVQTMPLRFDWVLRTFQTASHVHGIPVWGVWVPSHVVVGLWFHIYIITTTDTSPDLWGVGEILLDVSLQLMPLCFDWGCRTFQTAFHVHAIHMRVVPAPSQVVDGHIELSSHYCHRRHFPRFVRVGWNPTWCKCANHATTLWLRL